ncbi:hypothetical protein [Paramicrobacterium chengjingii]|uniref:hypothetical protein n=1 Tax=Paramicrobacterium chengjingii TaxID=2769067 RepID=UPI00142434A1|nr:hypothetical protein [Microbacterium chengjingii]
MTSVTAEQVGRNLHLVVEGAGDAFVISPLPGWAGMALTQQYLGIATGNIEPTGMEALLMHAVDGVTPEREWIEDGPVYTDIQNRLSLAEAQDVLIPAMLWQTVLGTKGVRTYLDEGGGDKGGVKALWSLVSTLGGSSSLISPASALETLIQSQADTRPTSSPQSGGRPGKKPQDRKTSSKNSPKG